MDVLRLEVEIVLSSGEPGIEGRWRSHLFAASPESLGGLAPTMESEIGTALQLRSGGSERLRLTYEIGSGELDAWLSTEDRRDSVVVEITELC